MDDIQKQLTEQKELLERIYISTEKTRRMFTWTLIISVVVIILPLIGMAFVIPTLMSTYSGLLQ
ncbi:MAG: hypothetical protein UY61_C0029G0013 [Candidatus Adlerbacteria bacterium GW2011_GWC1_50_9]|uniref:Uncharacterized protein n=1 Tax=Candidatus Adlerbacteria bacterium GW2011_GWC1_50_9 TaxID=1618608 RepID=A0A0G1WPT7_9BACT|nr:MAG: hypothetical protein UY61_C0029G0013 [Candidatus Adlerbacteria bacterium GW2011_GWC1_50_9]